MNITFTEDLNNSSSSAFFNLANKVEKALLPPLKKALLAVKKIDVYGFKPGSVVAQYYIITDADTSVDASQLQSAITSVVTSGNVTGLNVDTTYVPTLKGILKVFQMYLSSIYWVTRKRPVFEKLKSVKYIGNCLFLSWKFNSLSLLSVFIDSRKMVKFWSILYHITF